MKPPAVLSEIDQLVMMVWCPWCGALPEAPCRTASKGEPTAPHRDRRHPVDHAYHLGYRAGFENGLNERTDDARE